MIKIRVLVCYCLFEKKTDIEHLACGMVFASILNKFVIQPHISIFHFYSQIAAHFGHLTHLMRPLQQMNASETI